MHLTWHGISTYLRIIYRYNIMYLLRVIYTSRALSKNLSTPLSTLSTHRELELLVAAKVPGGEAVAVARLVRALGGVEGQQVAALHARHAQPPACTAR